MAKLFVWLLVLAGLAWFWFGRKRRPNDPPQRRTATGKGEAMVTCAYCRLHIPESEAIVADGRHYCSAEHRRLGAPQS